MFSWVSGNNIYFNVKIKHLAGRYLRNSNRIIKNRKQKKASSMGTSLKFNNHQPYFGNNTLSITWTTPFVPAKSAATTVASPIITFPSLIDTVAV
ncbi:hypothetical protein SAMN04488519_11170 [Algoriphagus ornithinivorans]|uniref:Uncharacterized protein n=1 Tax=Algoriphagus ornithinivorans TaxID=226506 RepID=A0A1I5J467_9BACT|nr:hypothetical protein SAMN04488519_11170 [Algoriphagus ornithinivorans]